MSEEPFFTVNAEPDTTPAITFRSDAVRTLDLNIRVHSARIAAADELFDCLQEAIRKTCYYCLEGNMLDPSHAGEHCPFSQKEPCMVQKWKDTLKRAGKEPVNIYVMLTKLKRRRK